MVVLRWLCLGVYIGLFGFLWAFVLCVLPRGILQERHDEIDLLEI